MRLSQACVAIAVATLVVTGVAQARPGGGGGRPSMGHVGGGGARPAMAARPAMPQGRPAMPQARPQMPRPQMPMTRPAMPAQQPLNRPAPGGGMARPQVPNFQRPSVGTMQRPNPARPSLPNAMARPQPQIPQAGIGARPGLGSIRPSGPVGGAGVAGRPGGVPSAGMTRPAPQPGWPGFGSSPGSASRPGGGFATKPAPGFRPGPAGGDRPGVTTLPGQVGNRPGVPTTKPSFPNPGLPGLGGGAGGNRPGRPGLGDANRPTTLPGMIGGNRPGQGGGNRPPPPTGDLGGNRPGPGGGGNRPGIGGNRPTTLPGDLTENRPGGNRPGGNRPDGNRPGGNRPGIGGNRPGIGGNRPGIGGNRPTPLPGDLGGWQGGQWPGGNRPNRPGIGGNRPGLGHGDRPWNNGNWNNNAFINVGGGGWGYPGWGYGGNGWNHGWVNPHYNGWYNGGWGGNWGYNGGWWAPFLTGAATWGLVSSLGGWGLGYGALGYGSAGYVNPYYAAMPASVVATSPYDYSQPVIINNYIPADTVTATTEPTQPAAAAEPSASQSSPGDALVDAALAKFKAGDYTGALAGFDQALKLSPKDSVIHEVRALALFALGRYPEAAAALNAVLATAPGMDWTTMSNVYGSVDAYTGHLRKLEEFCRTHPDDAAAHFVLGYHYLVGGSSDMAAAALKVVVAKQPGDVVAKRLLEALSPPAATEPAVAPDAGSAPAPAAAEATDTAALPDIDLVGSWKATSGKDTIELEVTAESTFTWKARPDGKPAVDLKGTIETAADAIALVSESAGTMVAKVTPRDADSFEFALPSAPSDAPPLVFSRQR